MKNISLYLFLIITVMLSFTNPLICVAALLFINFYIDKIALFSILSLTTVISIFNSLRVTSSDLNTYIERYNYNGQQNLYDFFSTINSDFIFYYINKLLYYIFNGNANIMIFFWSFVIYFSLAYSILLLYKNKKLTKEAFILGLFILFFSTILLSLSSHLIRQMTAGSLFTLYLVSVFVQKRKSVLLVGVIGIHFSSIILLVSLYIKNVKFYYFLGVLAIFIILSGANIFDLLLSHIPFIDLHSNNMILNQIYGAIHKTKNDGSVPFSVYILSIIFILFFIFLIYKEKKIEYKNIFFSFIYIFILFNLFYPIQLLWLRYSFYQYPLYFIIFPILFNYIQIKIPIMSIVYIIFSVLIVLNFYFYFENNYWSNLYQKINLIDKNIFYLFNLT